MEQKSPQILASPGLHPFKNFPQKSWIAAEEEYFHKVDDDYSKSKDLSQTNYLNKSRNVLFKLSAAQFPKKIKKLMCANRGEIAIRVFRAAHELGLETVAVYSHEDRMALHRYAADESYLIGKGKSPVGAYLDIPDVIRVAKDCGVDAIHPGYGFLAENAEFAKAVTDAGIIFVGPSSDVINTFGDKSKARAAAIKCNVPVIPGSNGHCKSSDDAVAFAKEYGLPIIIKAAFGGGGRGMRVVTEEKEIVQSFDRATSEALASFGNGSVFIEKFLEDPQHIEVQVIGDLKGDLVHVYERDCSVQRRHQKVVEIAPAQNLDGELRSKILADAVKLTKHVGYTNAGTVEFLVSKGKHYFIEVNPRIQVEHTVTEQVTGIDLVRNQICIAGGMTLLQLRLQQEKIQCKGCAIQLRITTEDPINNFTPDTGRLEVYRSSGGPGIRLDSSTTAGRIITPHYDSLLVKVTSYAQSFHEAVFRALRAIIEFRIRGVKTNIAFLHRVLLHPKFLNEKGTNTRFIDRNPILFSTIQPENRQSKLLKFLSDVVVNGVDLPNIVEIPKIDPKVPEYTFQFDQKQDDLRGWRDIILDEGPKAFAKAVRKHKGLLLMDTTWRDAHQSLLATRVRTYDMKKIAPITSEILQNCYSLEMWGGATFDVCLRFLKECPWNRLDTLRELVPNIPFQMLLRGANAVGYTGYPDNVVYEFVAQAKEHGIDIFRVFDSLNYIENLKLGIDAVHTAGGVVECCICYTGDVTNKSKDNKYNLDYYLNLVSELVELDIHILCIKDMAGLLKPRSASYLVSAIRKKFPDLPIHVHTHDTAGTGVASMLACAEAGADAVDAAIDCLSGLTSQPSMGAIVNATRGSELDTGIEPSLIRKLNDYWEQTRKLYCAFESPSLRSGNSDVYLHEMPGGQYTNLQFQAFKLGLGDEWPQIKKAYAAANKALGDIIKVTPSSKVVGDLAQFMVQNKLDEVTVVKNAAELSFPSSVVSFFQGYIGQPYGGFPKEFQKGVLKSSVPIKGRPGASMPILDLAKLKKTLIEELDDPNLVRNVDVISAALYPKVTRDYLNFKKKFGDCAYLPTYYFFSAADMDVEFAVDLNKGQTQYVKLLAIGKVLDDGCREVFWEVNGNSRGVRIEDRNVDIKQEVRKKCNELDPGSVGAPMTGVVVELRCKVGLNVKKGDPLVILSAMKMETVVAAPTSGEVITIDVKAGDSLSAGDLLVTIKPNQ